MTMALEGLRGQHHVPAALYPQERPITHCTGGWIGHTGWSGEVQKISPPTGFDPQTIQPVASHYTDCTTQPTDLVVEGSNIKKHPKGTMHKCAIYFILSLTHSPTYLIIYLLSYLLTYFFFLSFILSYCTNLPGYYYKVVNNQYFLLIFQFIIFSTSYPLILFNFSACKMLLNKLRIDT
jgi:hypothetical protein